MIEIRRVVPIALALLAVSGAALAQNSAPAATTAGAGSALTELDTLVKIVVAAITGLAALLGLPLVLLTYRKTRAEITKLELEGNALREAQSAQGERSWDEEGNIRILVDRSPNTHIEVLADPRFLAPLLILLDFIFAWIVLTLANDLLAVFSFGLFRQLALIALALVLLLPIAWQVLRVRSILRPQRSSEEIQASIRQTKTTVYVLYAIIVLSSFFFGVLLVSIGNLTVAGWYLSWFLPSWGTLLVVLVPIGKPRLDRYILKLNKLDVQESKKA